MFYTEIMVLDADNQFIDYVHPALARKLLNEKKALVYSKEPFVIQLDNVASALVRSGRYTVKTI
jgi:hypothetical protein